MNSKIIQRIFTNFRQKTFNFLCRRKLKIIISIYLTHCLSIVFHYYSFTFPMLFSMTLQLREKKYDERACFRYMIKINVRDEQVNSGWQNNNKTVDIRFKTCF